MPYLEETLEFVRGGWHLLLSELLLLLLLKLLLLLLLLLMLLHGIWIEVYGGVEGGHGGEACLGDWRQLKVSGLSRLWKRMAR